MPINFDDSSKPRRGRSKVDHSALVTQADAARQKASTSIAQTQVDHVASIKDFLLNTAEQRQSFLEQSSSIAARLLDPALAEQEFFAMLKDKMVGAETAGQVSVFSEEMSSIYDVDFRDIEYKALSSTATAIAGVIAGV